MHNVRYTIVSKKPCCCTGKYFPSLREAKDQLWEVFTPETRKEFMIGSYIDCIAQDGSIVSRTKINIDEDGRYSFGRPTPIY